MKENKYCSRCGKELEFVSKYEEISFDVETGKKIIKIFEVRQCEDFEEGYSDRYWNIHDRVTVIIER